MEKESLENANKLQKFSKAFSFKRSHFCNDLRVSDRGKKVTLMGWVESLRDHGGLTFIMLRDRTGVIQVLCDAEGESSDPSLKAIKSLKNESVVAVCGEALIRPTEKENLNLPTGKVEVRAELLHVFSQSKELPFQISSTELALKKKKKKEKEKNEESSFRSDSLGLTKASENLRLKYRYLDLRSSKLQSFLFRRHQALQAVRQFLSKEGFLEIETPLLYKSTPEGAQDYLVPSRIYPGQFYALPQSPQTLKQLLIIGGVDRYFQIPKCFRDEDLRANRQPEFTQIDMEMSFVENEEDIMEVNERLLKFLWKVILGKEIKSPLPRLSYKEAIERFGTDRPDLRIPWEFKDLSSLLRSSKAEIFKKALALENGGVLALKVPLKEQLSQTRLKKWVDKAKEYGAKGLLWIQAKGDQWTSPLNKVLSQEKLKEIFLASGDLKSKSLLFLVADEKKKARTFLSALRTDWAKSLDLLPSSEEHFLWVTEFPLFEFDEESQKWSACHHPFTAPKTEDLSILFERRESEYHTLQAKSYDLVCNGEELGGGSLRVYHSHLQKALFSCLGLTEEEVQRKFGFFIEALDYGAPPHAGMAWGFDRLVAFLCGTPVIRDVIAFPKTRKAADLMSGSPDIVDKKALKELGLSLLE